MKESREERLDSLKKLLKDALEKGEITEDLCKTVHWNQDDYRSMGINPYALIELFELKGKLAFCPDPHLYFIDRLERLNYIYENANCPDIVLSDENERRFRDAVCSYYSTESLYKEKVNELLRIVSDVHEKRMPADKNLEELKRFRIDNLRVSDIKMLVGDSQTGTYISCRVDGKKQDERKLTLEDVQSRKIYTDAQALAMKYYQDVLDSNREKGLMIANERTLTRMDMPEVERLLDIYRNGMNKQEVMLAKASVEDRVDPFWYSSLLPDEFWKMSATDQKEKAFATLADYIKDIRPGMLTDAELIGLCKIPATDARSGREEEQNLMELSESFFPLIETSGEFGKDIVAYVEVMRGIGKNTPYKAQRSMEYYLTTRMFKDWDPHGMEDGFGRMKGCYYHPYINMENPAVKFAPNLMSEAQWHRLDIIYSDKGEFLPKGAFRKDRVTEVQIYPSSDGNTMIRCMIDGVQQSGREMLAGDVQSISDKTDRKALAVGYFSDAFGENMDKEYSLGR